MDQTAAQPSALPQGTAVQARLQHFPISFFAVVMGVNGWAIALLRAEQLLGWPPNLGIAALALAGLCFLAIAAIYTMKAIRLPQVVSKELHHPVKMSFFPTISISLLLFSIALLGLNMAVSWYLWLVGTVLHLLLTLYIMSVWIRHTTFEVKHISPAWFIPVVGNIIVPIAGVAHGMAEVSWFFFSVGLVFWLVLLTIFFYRIIFHAPLIDRLVPTLFILLAPPAVGFISYVRLMESISAGFVLDAFGRVLYYMAVFFFLLLLMQYRTFARLHFYLSWWAYSFPLAALTIASMLMYHQSDMRFFGMAASALLVVLSGVIVLLGGRTALAIKRGEICVEE